MTKIAFVGMEDYFFCATLALMFTIYRTNADDLDDRFLESLKAAFKHRQIEIVVSETDETEYLLRSPANRERLLKALNDLEQNKNIVVPDQQQFQ